MGNHPMTMYARSNKFKRKRMLVWLIQLTPLSLLQGPLREWARSWPTGTRLEAAK